MAMTDLLDTSEETVTVPHPYSGFEWVEQYCSSCKFCVTSEDNQSYCSNLDADAFVEGMLGLPILKPEKWYCPLWKPKAEG